MIQLILDRGVLPDGANELPAAVIFNGLKNLVENDFTMFVRGFQILFKFAGSLAIGTDILKFYSFQTSQIYILLPDFHRYRILLLKCILYRTKGQV
eukprot:SAG22_NODE_550_length_9202_cov_30.666484_1_plen_96_part_00